MEKDNKELRKSILLESAPEIIDNTNRKTKRRFRDVPWAILFLLFFGYVFIYGLIGKFWR